MAAVLKVKVSEGEIVFHRSTGVEGVPSWDVKIVRAERDGMVTTQSTMIVRQMARNIPLADSEPDTRLRHANEFAESLGTIIGASVVETATDPRRAAT